MMLWKFALACLAAVATVSFAQEYPTRSAGGIVPISPGGGLDLTARGVAQRMNEALGHSMVIANRTGGGGSIGAELAKAAAPDIQPHTVIPQQSRSQRT